MKRLLLLVSIFGFALLLMGCEEPERPIKIEVFSGTVKSVNGDYCDVKEGSDKDPLDCRIEAKIDTLTFCESYRVEYEYVEYGHGVIMRQYPKDYNEYNKCWRALLLKEGGIIEVIKRTWEDGRIRYELNP